MLQKRLTTLFTLLAFFPQVHSAFGAEDLKQALRRAQYLLNATVPSDADYSQYSGSKAQYQTAVRQFINHPNFYNVMLRYHQKVFGVGLPAEYIEELLREDIDNKTNKFAAITCERSEGANSRFRCFWTSNIDDGRSGGCPLVQEEAASVFWYPGIVAWVCPSILKACGHDLSSCFITYSDENEARNSELGTTEVFDSRFAVINSLGKQSAGLATAIVTENYPYTKILEPGLMAIDGAIAHFYRQPHHFKIDELRLPDDVLDFAKKMPLTDTRFKLVKSSQDNYALGGVLTSFGWLRRYDKNRTRANMLYERLLCRQFTSELPEVFPQDPGDLRTAPGCMDCHSVLDPLADFFKAWGEEGELYVGGAAQVETFFTAAECTGNSVADLASCIQANTGFATCQVHHVWEWLMGRVFYKDEDTLRSELTKYFVGTNYSMTELIYAIATHPTFLENSRGDGVVSDPLEEPPLGTLPGSEEVVCDKSSYDWATDIEPTSRTMCLSCHDGTGTALSLVTESDWNAWANDAVGSMNRRSMPRGSPDWSAVKTFSDTVKCWKENL